MPQFRGQKYAGYPAGGRFSVLAESSPQASPVLTPLAAPSTVPCHLQLVGSPVASPLCKPLAAGVGPPPLSLSRRTTASTPQSQPVAVTPVLSRTTTPTVVTQLGRS